MLNWFLKGLDHDLCAQEFIYKVYPWPFPCLIYTTSRSGWLVMASLTLHAR